MLDKGKIGSGIDWAKDIVLRKINDNLYAESFIILSRFELSDISLERVLLFFHNNYRILIFLDGSKLKEDLLKNMSEYFYKMKNCTGGEWDCFSWNENGKSYNDFNNVLKDKKGSKNIQEWYNLFDQIIDNISIEKNVFYKTIVANLRLREENNLDSKIIRNLALNEKVEFLDKIDSEIKINGVSGYWFKVKTKNDEVGWCFSGYLEKL